MNYGNLFLPLVSIFWKSLSAKLHLGRNNSFLFPVFFFIHQKLEQEDVYSCQSELLTNMR